MVFIKINKKYVKATLAVVLVLSLGLNIYSYLNNVELNDKYQSMVCISNQFYQANLISFITSTAEFDNPKDIEIFDITKGKVIKDVKPNSLIQKVAASYLNEITGVYVKVKAFPDQGYIIRIPLSPPIKVKNKWLNDFKINSVDEVFILLPKEGTPYLMVLDEKARPFFYNFKSDLNTLLKMLEFYPVPQQ